MCIRDRECIDTLAMKAGGEAGRLLAEYTESEQEPKSEQAATESEEASQIGNTSRSPGWRPRARREPPLRRSSAPEATVESAVAGAAGEEDGRSRRSSCPEEVWRGPGRSRLKGHRRAECVYDKDFSP
eukprot:TRINITY_DN24192_c0_g1_i1.p1 TRINITY_DN24192_c0_g1~~TRINITY_DN24192_c0_g1_i1.p1  ORF type:complete len:128 (-),score=21.93 TRINITY_DN24192_c0_g1_i1:175-558(-)